MFCWNLIKTFQIFISDHPYNHKQAEKLKSREMKEGWMMKDEWWRMNEEWWSMMNDEEWWMMISSCWGVWVTDRLTNWRTFVNVESLSRLKTLIAILNGCLKLSKVLSNMLHIRQKVWLAHKAGFRDADASRNSEYNDNGTKWGGGVWPESLKGGH